MAKLLLTFIYISSQFKVKLNVQSLIFDFHRRCYREWIEPIGDENVGKHLNCCNFRFRDNFQPCFQLKLFWLEFRGFRSNACCLIFLQQVNSTGAYIFVAVDCIHFWLGYTIAECQQISLLVLFSNPESNCSLTSSNFSLLGEAIFTHLIFWLLLLNFKNLESNVPIDVGSC